MLKRIMALFLTILLLAGCTVEPYIEKRPRVPEYLLEYVEDAVITSVTEGHKRTTYLILMSDRSEAKATIETVEDTMVVRVEDFRTRLTPYVREELTR